MKDFSTSDDFVRVFARADGDNGAKLVFEAWHAKRPLRPENVHIDVSEFDGKIVVTVRATPSVAKRGHHHKPEVERLRTENARLRHAAAGLIAPIQEMAFGTGRNEAA